MAQPDTQAPAHCYRHPGREAYIRCTRCDRAICPECMRPASVGFHCPDDAREGARSIRRPRTGVGAVVSSGAPIVTGTLVGLNVLAYVATGLSAGGSLADPGGSRLFQSWQLYPLAIHDQHQYYRLITSAFLHFDLLHIASNMLALAIVGAVVERLLGWWRFTALYLLGGLGGGVVVYAFGSQITVTAGASGAIFGVFGAALVLARRLGLDLQWLIGIVVLNFVLTFSISGISILGHIGGFVTGLLLGLAIGGLPTRRARVPTGWQSGGLAAVLALEVLIMLVRSLTW